MAKEWVLNSATNRFQLNFKRNVGATSEAIRKCEPKNIKEWREYYYKNIRSKEHIAELGRKLYVKISEVLIPEIDSVTENDCINYIENLVINRTYDGYKREIETIYGQLEKELEVKIEPAPDEWDRLYNVDFFIKIKKSYIGLQIKPEATSRSISEIFKEENIQEITHQKFTKEFHGKVFYIYSRKENGKKIISNESVIDEIREEMKNLSSKQN